MGRQPPYEYASPFALETAGGAGYRARFCMTLAGLHLTSCRCAAAAPVRLLASFACAHSHLLLSPPSYDYKPPLRLRATPSYDYKRPAPQAIRRRHAPSGRRGACVHGGEYARCALYSLSPLAAARAADGAARQRFRRHLMTLGVRGARATQEVKQVFEKMHKYIGKSIKNLIERPDDPHCLRLHKNVRIASPLPCAGSTAVLPHPRITRDIHQC
jgi:hypothetical protein